jgi:ribonuclease J
VNQIFMPNAQPLASERKILAKDTPTKIGGFTVTGYLVDHSAPDALALLVEADGKRVFYSGDLRAHGRKKSLFEKLVRQPPRDVDAMLLEGTTLGRGVGKEQPDEEAVEEQLVEALKQRRNMTFLFCSAQNIDRLVSAFKAVRHTKTILVMDLYTAWVLNELSVLSSKLPQYNWNNVKVKYDGYYASLLIKAGHKPFVAAVKRSGWITPEEVNAQRADILMLARGNTLFERTAKMLDSLDGIQLIWSMWEGYWEGSVVEKFSEKHGIPKTTIHTSGHASATDLQRLAKAINPKKTIPIHTENPERYDELFPNVCRVKDGQALEL